MAARSRTATSVAPRSRGKKSAPSRAARQQSAVHSLRRIIRGMRLAAGETPSESGITAAQLFVLSQLDAAPAPSLNELGARTMTDRTSVAPLVDRLMERGFVTSAPSATDRRRRIITITAAGRRMLRHAPRPPAAILVDGLAQLPDDTLATLDRALRQLVRAMGLDESPAALLFDDGRR